MKQTLFRTGVALMMTCGFALQAQAQEAPTRAQRVAELANLEQAGYNPTESSPAYPSDLSAAEQKVAARNGVTRVADGAPVGTPPSGTVQR
ncbi:DUF4148 domain-containing protein [Pararobbsia silviterrae]|nr:DUF4148 domain-containing protein [Pararobbsia silviterrae]